MAGEATATGVSFNPPATVASTGITCKLVQNGNTHSFTMVLPGDATVLVRTFTGPLAPVTLLCTRAFANLTDGTTVSTPNLCS